ncbi:hypothetical protein BC938DRAFT_481568 [Jimgerdemannia flammicorona]|uniref:Uncharacterized protein n=1 Tax=Jimgerdemannia flammicorona TaxID=994334 RepID=A0A433QFU6_9FUNG|nr:hypothetical protein BC938DRAFT_481568 [Jimgerdemannia flammicorona]
MRTMRLSILEPFDESFPCSFLTERPSPTTSSRSLRTTWSSQITKTGRLEGDTKSPKRPPTLCPCINGNQYRGKTS